MSISMTVFFGRFKKESKEAINAAHLSEVKQD